MLDEDQARVVAHDDGPAAVLAGAGSGKTRCTTERALRRLTQCGIAGSAMLLLTFTNKAAGEMRERLRGRLPDGVDLPWIGTFHAFGSRLLRLHGRSIGVPANATLMDPEDARRMLDALFAGPFPARDRRQRILALQELVAASGLDVTEPRDLPAIRDLLDERGFGPGATARFLQCLRRYDRDKRAAGILDFSDLVLLPIRLLRCEPGLAGDLRGGLRDVTVDEAQDTDAAQFRLLQYLVPATRTLLLVGDDDQAIYEWRHARPGNMRDFITGYQARVFRLERNYRSTPAIVTGGTALVRHNGERLEKHPYAVRGAPDGDCLQLLLHADVDAMADRVAAMLAQRLAAGGDPDDIAVLYRKNRLARALEPALLRHGVPYRIRAGTDLLGFADVRMMLAVGRLAANPADGRALSRLADLVPGLGARGVGRLLEADAGDPLGQSGRLAPATAGALQSLADGIAGLRRLGPAALSDWCLGAPQFLRWLRNRARRAAGSGPAPSSPAALDAALAPARARMAALQRAMDRRMGALDAGEDAASRWATALEVITSSADDAEPDRSLVTLCSIHAAKGLEWSEVHLFGFSDGLIPMAREGAVGNLAEERRLAYVAMTRAGTRLVLHHAERADPGSAQGPATLSVSRFLDEVQAGQPVRVEDCRYPADDLSGARDGDAPAPGDWLQRMRRQLRVDDR